MYIFLRKMNNKEELIENIDRLSIIKKIQIIYRYLFNKVTIKKIDNIHYLYIIPKCTKKKIEKIISKNSDKNIILSKDLQVYKNSLKKENKNILIYFTYYILEYLMNKTERKIEEENLYILTNEYNELNISIISFLVDKVKTLTIVTDNIKRFETLEEKIYNKKGILINVSNNKRRILRKAEIIINLDFDTKQINMYKINRNAIIINTSNNKIDITYFQGILINDIKIDFKKKDKYKELFDYFNKLDIYNSFEIFNLKYIDILNKMLYNDMTIKKLIGFSGEISQKELKNYKK